MIAHFQTGHQDVALLTRSLIAFAVCMGSELSLASPVDLSAPPAALGSCSEDGYLHLIQELGKVELGKKAQLPLRLDFSSGRLNRVSEFGWSGWSCGVLEAGAEPYGGIEFLRVRLLCAKELFLKRDGPAKNTYRALDGSWQGSLQQGVIRVWRDDGWELVFEAGQIARLQTDAGRRYLWERDDLGKLTAIRETESGKAWLEVEWAEDRKTVAALQTASDRYEFEFDGGALSSVSWNSGSLVPARLQMRQTPTTLSVERERDAPLNYEWDSATGRLARDPLGTYQYSPGEAGGTGPLLEWVRSDGSVLKKQNDKAKGVSRVWRADGSQIVERRISALGPLHNELARLDWVLGDQVVVLMRNHYGLGGRIDKREWRGDPRTLAGWSSGRVEEAFFPHSHTQYPDEDVPADVADLKLFEIAYQYDAASRHTATLVDGEPVYSQTWTGRGRLLSEEATGRFRREFADGEGGRTEERVILMDEALAIARAFVTARIKDNQGRVVEERFLDGRVARHRIDEAGRTVETTAIAPDGASEIERVRFAYDQEGRRRFEIRRNALTGLETRSEALLNQDGSVGTAFVIKGAPEWVSAAFLNPEPPATEPNVPPLK